MAEKMVTHVFRSMDKPPLCLQTTGLHSLWTGWVCVVRKEERSGWGDTINLICPLIYNCSSTLQTCCWLPNIRKYSWQNDEAIFTCFDYYLYKLEERHIDRKFHIIVKKYNFLFIVSRSFLTFVFPIILIKFTPMILFFSWTSNSRFKKKKKHSWW